MKVVTASEMRAMEMAADAGGLAYDQMMEKAGRAAAEALRRRWPPDAWPSVLVLVGPGNNGGDGLVMARYLAGWGYHVEAHVILGRPGHDPNLSAAVGAGVEVVLADAASDGIHLHQATLRADVVVDALLGTGASRPIEGTMAVALRIVRETAERRRRDECQLALLLGATEVPQDSRMRPRPGVLAVDLASGLNADTGALDPQALAADLTVTFACPKLGHFLFPGAESVGELVIADIGIPVALSEATDTTLLAGAWAASVMPARPLGAHKGTFGRALIVAGSVNYTGAAALAGAAAARIGAGLVTLAVGPSVRSVVAAFLPEATYLVLPESMGALRTEGAGLVARELGTTEAILVGCGLGRERGTVDLVRALVAGQEAHRAGRIGFVPSATESNHAPPRIPTVVDADGLNAVADWPGWAAKAAHPMVLTPHAGEMARLLGVGVADVNRDRFGIVRRAAREFGQVVVLKGAYTLVAAPDGRLAVSPFATPALATAGAGDVLAGAIVGLLAQGMERFEAAALGVYVHGVAGMLAHANTGSSGALASDLLPLLPRVMRGLRRE